MKALPTEYSGWYTRKANLNEAINNLMLIGQYAYALLDRAAIDLTMKRVDSGVKLLHALVNKVGENVALVVERSQ